MVIDYRWLALFLTIFFVVVGYVRWNQEAVLDENFTAKIVDCIETPRVSLGDMAVLKEIVDRRSPSEVKNQRTIHLPISRCIVGRTVFLKKKTRFGVVHYIEENKYNPFR